MIYTTSEIMNPSEKSLIIQNIQWSTSLKQAHELKKNLEDYHVGSLKTSFDRLE